MSTLADIFSYLADVVSGRIRHWNETNNVIIKELWGKVENLPKPFDLVLRHFLVSAGIVVESLVGPNRRSKQILDIELKKISIQQFRHLYSVLLAYFCFMFYVVNPFLKEQLQRTLLEIVAEPQSVLKLLRSLERIGKLDMARLSGEVWDKVVDVTGFGTKDHAGQLVYFGMVAGHAYVEAAKRIKAELTIPVFVQ